MIVNFMHVENGGIKMMGNCALFHDFERIIHSRGGEKDDIL